MQNITQKKKPELLFSVGIKDCKVDTFCGSGPGGQHRNRSQTAIRVTHTPSGAVGTCSELKSQLSNKQQAFRRMAETSEFKRWQRLEVARRSGQPSIARQVKDELAPGKLKIDIQNGNSWIESKELLPDEQEIANLFD